MTSSNWNSAAPRKEGSTAADSGKVAIRRGGVGSGGPPGGGSIRAQERTERTGKTGKRRMLKTRRDHPVALHVTDFPVLINIPKAPAFGSAPRVVPSTCSVSAAHVR